MGAARYIVLLVALVAAIGLAVLVRGMVSRDEAPVQTAEAAPPPTPMARVLVAKRDLPVGSRLGAADIGWQPWPIDGLNPAFITDGSAPAVPAETAMEKAAEGAAAAMEALTGSAALDSMVGAIVKEEILVGEPIQNRKLVRGGEGGYLAVVLGPGMRAMGIPVTVESGAGGFILPGDRVDVIQSREIPSEDGGMPRRITGPVVRNVQVLAIDQATAASEESNALIGAVATLEVSPEAADALTEAMALGQMQLALRSFADLGQPTGRAWDPAPSVDEGARSTIKIYSQGETTEVAVSQ